MQRDNNRKKVSETSGVSVEFQSLPSHTPPASHGPKETSQKAAILTSNQTLTPAIAGKEATGGRAVAPTFASDPENMPQAEGA